MPNSFTTTTTAGYGTRIGQSFGGVIFGVLLFFGSFVVLFLNEGRTDLSRIAKTAVEISSDAADLPNQGTLISQTGVVTSTETLGDAMYLRDGQYLTVSRSVEMYAWVEKKTDSTHKNLGGSETTTSTYNYVTEWTENPMDAAKMQYPDEHQNPPLTVENATSSVQTVLVGTRRVDGAVDLPAPASLHLTNDIVLLTDDSVLSGEYIFHGNGTMATPQVGDIRVSYQVLKPGFTGTVFGMLQGETIAQYSDEAGHSLFRIFRGTRAEGISALHGEFVTMGWVLRLVGFLMMWFGLTLILGPLSTILDVLPFLGTTSRFMIGLVTLLVSAVLSVVTIIVSMVLHSVVALIVVVLLCVVGTFAALKIQSTRLQKTV